MIWGYPHLWKPPYQFPNSVVKTMSYTTHDWDWFPSHKNGDDWGMVYDCLNHINQYGWYFFNHQFPNHQWIGFTLWSMDVYGGCEWNFFCCGLW